MINSVAIIGAGTMGIGIAQMSAMANKTTILYDQSTDACETALKQIRSNLEKAAERGKISSDKINSIFGLISIADNLQDVKADFIIEAIVEVLQVKQNLFNELEKINSIDTILASNTSSIPISKIAAALANPERMVGMHFFNPAHIMKLVEVIQGKNTSDQVVNETRALAKEMNKTDVLVQDSPGFIVNRVARQFYLESLKSLENDAASLENIDKIMEGIGFKLGPFRLMDLIGVDTNHSVTTSMYHSFNKEERFSPSPIQQQMVDDGLFGKKSGNGFYDYS